MKELLLWMLLAQGADAVTTGIGVHRGCVEVGIVGQHINYPTFMVVKGGAMVGMTFTFGRKKDSKLSKIAVGSFAAAGTFGALWNVRQIPRCQHQ